MMFAGSGNTQQDGKAGEAADDARIMTGELAETLAVLVLPALLLSSANLFLG